MQNAFLGGRLMTDNIHLLQELLRNYGRKRTSPRCMMKIDFKKAFDSVQWPFLHQLLLLLGFPSRFVHLIMQCVETASYFVAVNGSIYDFFFRGKMEFGKGILYPPTFFWFAWNTSQECYAKLPYLLDFGSTLSVTLLGCAI